MIRSWPLFIRAALFLVFTAGSFWFFMGPFNFENQHTATDHAENPDPPEESTPESKADEDEGRIDTSIEPEPIASLAPPKKYITEDVYLRTDEHVAGIEVTNYNSYEKQVVQMGRDDGPMLNVSVYLLFDQASWSFKSKTKFVNSANRRTDIESIFAAPEFSRDFSEFQSVVCLGLESSAGTQTLNLSLSRDRAELLCSELSKQRFIDHERTKLFGIPLGQHTDVGAKPKSNAERRERGVVIIGISGLDGAPATSEDREVMLRAMLANDVLINTETLKGFKFSRYSEIKRHAPLEYVSISRGDFRD